MVKDAYLIAKCEEIDRTLRNAIVWANTDAQLGAHLATYLSALMLGAIEDCIEHIVEQRVNRIADIEVKSYMKTTIDERFRNPDYAAISGLLGKFSKSYQVAFADKIPPNSKEAWALQSIVNHKNNLTHYGVCNLGLTLNDVKEYYNGMALVLHAIEEILS